MPATALRSLATPPLMGEWACGPLLGQGHWCQVFLARPSHRGPADPHDYVLKVPHPRAAEKSWAIEMLVREKEVAQAVQHPGLQTVLESRLSHHPPYLLQPRYRGSSLADRIRPRDPDRPAGLPPAQALWAARQVAEALEALHGAGWCHGDIKPANLQMGPDGHVTVLDMGLAFRPGVIHRFHERRLAGTLRYAAPEHFLALGEPGRPADIYALGVTLFELLTGHPPFDHDAAEELADAHLRRPLPRMRLQTLDAAPDLRALVERLTAKVAAQRPTALEAARRLLRAEVQHLGDRFPAID